MIKHKAIILPFIITVLTIVTYAHADLKTLMKMGRNQTAINKALTKETKNYNKVKDAIASGKIEEGMPAKKIRRKYGNPIFDNIYDKKRNAYKWLYMPATSTHFKGEKMYLFVDVNDELVGWKFMEE